MTLEKRQLESTIQDSILKFLNKRKGACFFKKDQGRHSKRGILDIIGTCAELKGIYCEIEIKSEKGVVSKLQEARIKRVHRSGGVSFTARNVQDIKNILKLD